MAEKEPSTPAESGEKTLRLPPFPLDTTMTDPRILSAALVALLGTTLASQRDILSPFRDPRNFIPIPEQMTDVYRQLQIMKSTAESLGPVRFDSQGREVCDHPRWKAAYEVLRGYDIDAGFLSYVLRSSGSYEDRDIALYGSYFVDNPDWVLDLIEHIPGEPIRSLREKAYVRALNYLKVHLTRRYGDLTEEQLGALASNRPPLGSPVARSMGITSNPKPEDRLHSINLHPFVELLEVDSASDQAQGLWFLKECFWIHKELAVVWMEQMTPRLRLFLKSEDESIRTETFELIEAADPKSRPAPPTDSDPSDVETWLSAVLYELYPPIRVISNGLIELYPSADLDEVVEVGTELLKRDGIGSVRNGQTNTGAHYRGFHIGRTPEPLNKLGLPIGAIITSINGQPVSESAQLLEVIKTQLEVRLQFLVEYVHDGEMLALEYRVRK